MTYEVKNTQKSYDITSINNHTELMLYRVNNRSESSVPVPSSGLQVCSKADNIIVAHMLNPLCRHQ